MPGSGVAAHAASSRAAAVPQGEFFIVASVNRQANEFFLKAPTEVTQLILVNGDTAFLNSEGQHIQFNSLRAGDTVYVVSQPGPNNKRLALRVQEGPMTLVELHQRYLK